MAWAVKHKWNGGEGIVGIFGKKSEAQKFARAEQEVMEKYFSFNKKREDFRQWFFVEEWKVGK